jgi:hypothetical protein
MDDFILGIRMDFALQDPYAIYKVSGLYDPPPSGGVDYPEPTMEASMKEVKLTLKPNPTVERLWLAWSVMAIFSSFGFAAASLGQEDWFLLGLWTITLVAYIRMMTRIADNLPPTWREVAEAATKASLVNEEAYVAVFHELSAERDRSLRALDALRSLGNAVVMGSQSDVESACRHAGTVVRLVELAESCSDCGAPIREGRRPNHTVTCSRPDDV